MFNNFYKQLFSKNINNILDVLESSSIDPIYLKDDNEDIIKEELYNYVDNFLWMFDEFADTRSYKDTATDLKSKIARVTLLLNTSEIETN